MFLGGVNGFPLKYEFGQEKHGDFQGLVWQGIVTLDVCGEDECSHGLNIRMHISHRHIFPPHHPIVTRHSTLHIDVSTGNLLTFCKICPLDGVGGKYALPSALLHSLGGFKEYSAVATFSSSSQ